MEGALKAYKSIQASDPKAKSQTLDALLAAQARGDLPAAMQTANAGCLSKG